MHDDAKHLDTHSDEMQEMLGTAISKEIKRIADKEGYCPECATLSLLEVVACMATMTGISVEEAISTATAGANPVKQFSNSVKRISHQGGSIRES